VATAVMAVAAATAAVAAAGDTTRSLRLQISFSPLFPEDRARFWGSGQNHIGTKDCHIPEVNESFQGLVSGSFLRIWARVIHTGKSGTRNL